MSILSPAFVIDEYVITNIITYDSTHQQSRGWSNTVCVTKYWFYGLLFTWNTTGKSRGVGGGIIAISIMHALHRYILQNPKITCYDVYDVAIMATTASGPLIPELADPTLITLELDNLETNQLHVAEITGVQTSGSRTALISECYTMLFITSLENVCVASWELPCIGSAKLIRVLQSTS